jgi:hypothetical protein
VVGIPKLPISVPLRIPFCVDMANMGKSFLVVQRYPAFHSCHSWSFQWSQVCVAVPELHFQRTMDLATCLMYLLHSWTYHTYNKI